MSVAPAPSRRRRRWPIVLAVVLVVLAALVVVAEFVLRGVVDRIIAEQVDEALPAGTTGEVQAHAEGIVIPQLLRGSLDEVAISSDRITVEGIPLAADVTAHDVPVDGTGDVQDVDGTVTLAADAVKDLSRYSPLFDRVRLADGGVVLRGSTAVLGYQIRYSAEGAVVAQSDGRGITITPQSVRIDNTALGLDVDSIPGSRRCRCRCARRSSCRNSSASGRSTSPRRRRRSASRRTRCRSTRPACARWVAAADGRRPRVRPGAWVAFCTVRVTRAWRRGSAR